MKQLLARCAVQASSACTIETPGACLPKPPAQRLWHGSGVAPYAANLAVVLARR